MYNVQCQKTIDVQYVNADADHMEQTTLPVVWEACSPPPDIWCLNGNEMSSTIDYDYDID